MTDRVPGAPGQYSAVVQNTELEKLQNGENFTITLTRDDQPITEGTPYSKASVLPDDLAQRLCPEVVDPAPKDAFEALLDGKAPAGYGLGNQEARLILRTKADVDSFRKTGWAYYNGEYIPSGSPTLFDDVEDIGVLDDADSTAYGGAPAGIVADILCEFGDGSSGTQEARLLNGCRLRRFCRSGSWEPWEWLDPPMLEGVEYRTTERFAGKPVYTKLFNFGELPDNSDKYIDTGISGLNAVDMHVILHRTSGGYNFVPLIDTDFQAHTRIHLRYGGSLHIITDKNISDYTARIILKYTK